MQPSTVNHKETICQSVDLEIFLQSQRKFLVKLYQLTQVLIEMIIIKIVQVSQHKHFEFDTFTVCGRLKNIKIIFEFYRTTGEVQT